LEQVGPQRLYRVLQIQLLEEMLEQFQLLIQLHLPVVEVVVVMV
jgi:hypothetical protein